MLLTCLAILALQGGEIHDKTLVVWAAPSTLAQHAGSALTIDDGESHFDAVDFGEIHQNVWMAGSDNFRRTVQDQTGWKPETTTNEFVQIAIVYRGQTITLFRNGHEYGHYEMPNPPQQFGMQSVVMFGRRHLEVSDKENSFTGRIKDARVYDTALPPRVIGELQPGTTAGGPKPWAWWSFADSGVLEKTGRFTRMSTVGDVRVENGALVLGGGGATLIESAKAEGEDVGIPNTWSMTGPVPSEVVRSTRMLRERMLADPYRPGYHFCDPEDIGIPGDPNGAFYYKGTYHLMYLYNRAGSGFSWGHVSSQDLIHWRHHPDAIVPGDGDSGCFSGGAYVEPDGTAYLTYWMLGGKGGIGMAKSSPPYENWTKLSSNPVIASTEVGISQMVGPDGKTIYVGCADPSNIWKSDGKYYMVTGSLVVLNKIGRAPNAPLSEQGDRVYLFESDDLKSWTYKHVFYQRNPKWTDRSEDDMCPSFLPLPSRPDGGSPSGKDLLLFISHNRGCQYYVGQTANETFTPQSHGRMTWIDNTYFAPEALIDGSGRQIMWAWLTDNPANDGSNGWSGVYGMPGTLWVAADGTLRMRPVSEIETLRSGPCDFGSFELATTKVLSGFDGASFELDTELSMGDAAHAGVRLRASADGAEQTLVYYDAEAKQLVFDSTRSGFTGRKVVERAPFELAAGEPLKLRVFVDKSVVEVYANDRQAICRRVYPKGKASLEVNLFSDRPVRVKSAKAWTMMPSNPY
jgi:beta-fructofuranosidase